MAALSTIAAVTSAVAAVGGATMSGVAQADAKRARKRSEARQKQAQKQAEGEAASQQRKQRAETMRQNRQEPDIAALIAEAEKPAGAASTFLTGQRGQAGADGQMGRNKLLGQ